MDHIIKICKLVYICFIYTNNKLLIKLNYFILNPSNEL